MGSCKADPSDVPIVVTFDDAFKTLGAFGRYQRRVFFVLCLMATSAAIQAIISVFTMATPDFRCAIPGSPNDTFSESGAGHEELLNLSIPWELADDDTPMRSQCLVYRNRNQSAPPEEVLPNRSTASCDRWVYDHSTFTSTFTEKADLVCGKKQYHVNADMIYMFGMLTGSIMTGIMSDRFGRKRALMLSLTLHVGCAVAIAFSPSFSVFVTLRFFMGLFNLGIYLTAYTLSLEMVGNSKRSLAGSVYQMFWPAGVLILTGVAYLLRDWSHLQLAMACPTVLFLSYGFFLMESPRWLASKGRYDEANAIMEKAAKVNGLPPPPKIGATDTEQEVRNENPLRMFTNMTTLSRMLIILLNWIVVTMVYYGLSLNVGNIGGNIYLNNLLSAVAELLGYLVALAGLDRLGRKGMHCSSMILGGLACIASIFPVMFAGPGHSKDWLVLVLSNLGKLGASSAFSIIYLFSAELYPTVARNSLVGASSTVARLGGIVSPYIARLNVIVGGDLGVALPLVVFGGSALVAGLLALLLPETLNRPLPETMEDAINFGKKAKEEPVKLTYINKTFMTC